MKNNKTELPEDTMWHAIISLALEANPNLCEDGKKLIVQEYDLEKASPVSIRKSLLHYFSAHNNLPVNDDDIVMAESKPWSFPVLVKNWEECKNYLFNE